MALNAYLGVFERLEVEEGDVGVEEVDGEVDRDEHSGSGPICCSMDLFRKSY